MTLRIPLDATDDAILRALQRDARRSYRDIAREAGVSEGTVRTRMRKLEHLGALRIVAFVDPTQLGGTQLAMMLIRVERDHHQAVVDEITRWPEATYVSTIIARVDVYAQFMCEDNAAVADLASRVRALEGVIEVEPMIETDVHKFSYARRG